MSVAVEADYTALIRGGTVVDGTGGSRYRADVGVRGDRVSAIGNLGAATGQTTIDATGLVVCPGFIDVHVHSEISLVGGRDQMAGALQGITTNLLAPDGFGWAPLDQPAGSELFAYTAPLYGNPRIGPIWPTIDSYLDRFTGATPLNVIPQVPHCAIRLAVIGWDARHATADELAEMEDGTRAWLDAGACALCLGLDYQPSANASFAELAHLCRVTAEHGGIYAAHQRYMHLGRSVAWRETIELGKASGCPVHVSHERVDAEAALALEQATREGVDLSFESYLYAGGMTHLVSALPIDLHPGGWPSVRERLHDPADQARIAAALTAYLGRGDQIIGYTTSGRLTGQRLGEAARAAEASLGEFARDLILREDGMVTVVLPWQTDPAEHEAVITRTAVYPRMMIASDGVYDIPHPHPRGYGCFARVLGEFVRERALLSLEQAVHKMSGFPAERFRVPDRGVLKAGRAADIAVFDPATVGARSTWERPLEPAAGLQWVLVSGVPVVANGAPTDARPGRVLARAGSTG